MNFTVIYHRSLFQYHQTHFLFFFSIEFIAQVRRRNGDWNSGSTASRIVNDCFDLQIQAQGIHHNLPDNLEIIDPKMLGLSGTDLEKFLGNVKVLPIEGYE